MGVVAALVLALGGLAWMMLSPGWAVDRLATEAQAQLGRVLTVKNGAHLSSVSPLAIRLDGVDLASAGGEDAPMVAAGSVTVPVGIGGLFARQADFSPRSPCRTPRWRS